MITVRPRLIKLSWESIRLWIVLERLGTNSSLRIDYRKFVCVFSLFSLSIDDFLLHIYIYILIYNFTYILVCTKLSSCIQVYICKISMYSLNLCIHIYYFSCCAQLQCPMRCLLNSHWCILSFWDTRYLLKFVTCFVVLLYFTIYPWELLSCIY